MKDKKYKISVIGLGKLGAPLAAVLAHKGHRVVGVDQDPQRIFLINEGRAPVFEPELGELIQNSCARLSATTQYEKAIEETEISFIVVPTPSGPQGRFSTEYTLQAAESIGRCLARKHRFHLVVLTSTVMPGDTECKILPTLEKYSGKQCGVDFGLCYNPEFVALGSVIRDLLQPDFVLIGESDPKSGEILENLYRELCEKVPPFARMNFVNAELTKLAVNTFVTTKITYANMLSQICERLPGADIDIVTHALGLDSRIGKKYLKGGLGYGGPCFPRDNVAFNRLGEELGVQAILAEATDRLNRLRVPQLAELVLKELPVKGTVGILGLTYKPNTDVVDASQGLELAHYLSLRGVAVVAYDPAGIEKAKQLLNHTINFAPSLEECVKPSDVIVICTPWEKFRGIPPEWLRREGVQRTLIDCWRLLDRSKHQEHVHYLALGVGEAGPLSQKRKEIPKVAQV